MIRIFQSFTFDSPPVASDRGMYTANISNLAGSANLSYTITVRFDPIITLEITQTGITDYKICCRAIAYPQIETIELFEIRSDGTLRNLHVNAGATSTTSNQLSSNFDYEGTATFAGTDNCPKNYRCKVSTSYSNGMNNTGTCLTTPNVTNLQVNETQSTSTSAYLFWSLEPNGILVTGYEFEYRLLGQNEWEQYSSSNCQSFLERYCVIDGLSPGNLYEFRVTATNSVGTGATSDIQSFHTFSPPQGRPRGVLASRKTSSGMDAIDLSWEPSQKIMPGSCMIFGKNLVKIYLR
ncbi:PREDICTED: contactin-1a-like [Amphimedon queenslandica]|uniref:Fibronectin type-III domain-containing protein n=1 Tax=Amphimedon queenslandica TaxID=400682 RepID=A0AAN0J5Z2_AMPQE|nr:PREDICTED: contactin-1a-like [Amphimedon queenslandica]|eukprot:XP_019852445.1 PREDICTED: contactin-1a-like [Amphimedon queenslandica]